MRLRHATNINIYTTLLKAVHKKYEFQLSISTINEIHVEHLHISNATDSYGSTCWVPNNWYLVLVGATW